jgi:hypothetical protein
MARLTFKQLLLAIAVGAVFAALQSKSPAIASTHRLSTAICAPAATNRC